METAKETAMRVVSRLLDGDTSAAPNDEQTDLEIAETEGDHKNQMGREKPNSSDKGQGVKKAWHQGKVPGAGSPGQGTVASKPGKLSYREALVNRVAENMKVKKAMKTNLVKGAGSPNAAVVSGKPGKVSHRESREFRQPSRAASMLESIVGRRAQVS